MQCTGLGVFSETSWINTVKIYFKWIVKSLKIIGQRFVRGGRIRLRLNPPRWQSFQPSKLLQERTDLDNVAGGTSHLYLLKHHIKN